MEDENNLRPDPNRVDPSENTDALPPDADHTEGEEEEDEGPEQ